MLLSVHTEFLNDAKNVSVQLSFSLGEDKKREHKRQHTSARKAAKQISEETTEVSCFLKTVWLLHCL
jgi:hypothetical protein